MKPAHSRRQPARRRRRSVVPRVIPRAVLDTAMTLAVIVLERRIRKALRSGAKKRDA
jgi:hypothetical protein